MSIVLDSMDKKPTRASDPEELRINKATLGYLANRFEIALVGVKLQQELKRKRQQLEQDRQA